MYQLVGAGRGYGFKFDHVTSFVCEDAIECHIPVMLEPVKYLYYCDKSLRLCHSPSVVELPTSSVKY
jgi:hypothetical protein